MYKNDIRALEAEADQNGISYLSLMENAGTCAAQTLIKNDIVNHQTAVLILCGTGNNGGDGYKIAACFANHFADKTITVLAVGGQPQTDIAQAMYREASAMANVCIVSSQNSEEINALFEGQDPLVVIDAIYGIGFRGELPAEVSRLFNRIRLVKNAVVAAVDIPSGMQADDGCVDPGVLQAACTLTFTERKKCMMFKDALAVCGVVTVCDVGIPQEMADRYRVQFGGLTRDTVADGLVMRQQHSHKGTYGTLYTLCGSYGMAGAAMLSGKAALRSGVGLLHMFLSQSIYPIVAGQLWEAVYHPLEETKDGGLAFLAVHEIVNAVNAASKGAFLCGPGVSRNKHTQRMIRKLLPQLRVPLILDADGLNAFIGHIDEWKAMSDNGVPLVITPHPAEAARLLGCTVEQVESDRIASAMQLSRQSGAVVVLKGTHTLITHPCGAVTVNTTACSGLAKGGSGDVLAGMIASLIAQGSDPYKACCSAVYLHGLCSLKVASRLSETGMLPTDLLDELAALLSQFEVRG